ncbi:uncharacterized protein LOC123314898 [Coccinella septempunctata]|uniref:uncharacterized protein LOC123314898 n=1 Tax=Coccinella septempunctata TaxID=41139 RepID=UPI001D08F3F7|nr:uncharacterized protein LOC123314898 [Coccinella septempunctata]
MEMENENNIQQDLCRLCNCESDENSEMFSIFDKTEGGQEILQLIQECLHLVVQKSDPFSKSVCADCLENLNSSFKFKKKCQEIDDSRRAPYRNNGEKSEHVSECTVHDTKENSLKNGSEDPEDNKIVAKCQKDVQTSTDGLLNFCSNCQSEILEAHKVDSEIELRAELHQAIADSFSRNKIVSSDKVLRSKRKRSQAFYHELDDSLCSSLTEFTNTESSQCFEFQSDVDSMEEEEERQAKRRKIETIEETVQPVSYETRFEEEDEYVYNSISLLKLCLNVINKENIPEYEAEHQTAELIEPTCNYCGQDFRNRKLLALHEVEHLNVELGEKVDIPSLWHESRDDADIRNKWLTSEDDLIEEENYMENETMGDVVEMEEEEEEESLLIPVGSSEQRDGQNYEETREVTLIDGKPFVDGLPLSDYAKEERRAFYHSMRVGGVNKRFCPLCRYSFKDNWAIESHYFSMACYYTCRYCGMRFNKQRNRFDEHVETHVQNKDEYSTKVFAASKSNNIVPKVLYPKKRYSGREQIMDPILPQPIEIKHFTIQNKKGTTPEIKVKQEPMDYTENQSLISCLSSQQNQPQLQTSQSKTGNQAYFCRKCYKVFFKLDEFNIHSKNCDYNQFANNSMLGSYLTSGNKPNGEPTSISNSGRPIRSCAKEAGPYRDEVYIPEHILKDQVQSSSSSSSQGPFVCYICNTPFPTVYSRNSHMRIHKSENMIPPPSANQLIQPKLPSYPEPYHQQSVAHLAEVKQEPMDFEPEVEIHEPVQENFTTNLSPAVSITPISKKPNQKLQINPSVMKLVQNNPQLSIRNRESSPQQTQQHNFQMQQHIQQMLAGTPDTDRTYKCSSCWESFANKSHLYFHKKNQCEGSKYPCPFCKKRFGTEAAYSSHIFYSHPE